MKRYGIIMAGGNGIRLWPLSRKKHPKQIARDLFGDTSLLDKTIERIKTLFDPNGLMLSAGLDHEEQMQRYLDARSEEVRCFYQPENRNNAPFTLYLAMKIIQEQGDGLMALFPCDHLVKDEVLFRWEMDEAMEEVASTGRILCLGTQPRYASTRFGYLRIDPASQQKVLPVKEFNEKPDFMLASEYLEDGRHLWNSGIYIFTAKTIVANFKRYLPRVYHAMQPLLPHMGTSSEQDVLNECYREVQDISLDYGIMEHTEDLYVYRSLTDWTDVGTYEALESILDLDKQNNHIRGPFTGIDCQNNLIFSEDLPVAAIGLQDSVVVVKDDVIFLAHKDRMKEVRKLVELLKEQGYDHLL